MTSRSCAARRAITVLGAVFVVALAMACGDDGEVGPAGPSAVGPAPTPLASMSGNVGQQGALSGSGGRTSSLGPQGSVRLVNEPGVRMADVDISVHSPTITNPPCGSSVTIYDSGAGTYYTLALLLSWEDTTITGVYWYIEDHHRTASEGRQTATTAVSVTASATWLEADARIEVTIVGETATATYPSGTGPGTKVVFTPKTSDTTQAESGCKTAQGQSSLQSAVERSFSSVGTIESLGSSGSSDHVIYVEQPSEPDPITATFSNVPTSHDGSTFTFDLGFDPEPEISFRVLKFDAFEVTGGRIHRTPRKVRSSNETWTVHVTPSGTGDVTITLPETTDCDDDGAICTADGGMLNHSSTATVSGP